MTEQLALPTMEGPLERAFREWVHTDEGRTAADRFIRIAYGCQKRGIRLGAKAIWERLRWNFMLRKAEGEKYRLNNNYTAYMARFAVDRVPTLAGFFEFRAVDSQSNNRSSVPPAAAGGG